MEENQVIPADAKRVGSLLLDLAKQQHQTQSKLQLTESLLEFQDAGLHVALGYGSFKDYCTDTLNIRPSTVRYYLQIARFMKEAGPSVSMEEWVALGPTRMRLLARVRTKGNRLARLVRKYSKIPSRKMAEDFPPR